MLRSAKNGYQRAKFSFLISKSQLISIFFDTTILKARNDETKQDSEPLLGGPIYAYTCILEKFSERCLHILPTCQSSYKRKF